MQNIGEDKATTHTRRTQDIHKPKKTTTKTQKNMLGLVYNSFSFLVDKIVPEKISPPPLTLRFTICFCSCHNPTFSLSQTCHNPSLTRFLYSLLQFVLFIPFFICAKILPGIARRT
jgi:hypothetical protein